MQMFTPRAYLMCILLKSARHNALLAAISFSLESRAC